RATNERTSPSRFRKANPSAWSRRAGGGASAAHSRAHANAEDAQVARREQREDADEECQDEENVEGRHTEVGPFPWRESDISDCREESQSKRGNCRGNGQEEVRTFESP